MLKYVRGKGLFIAFYLPDKENRSKFKELSFENGLISLICDSRSIRIRPDLDIMRKVLRNFIV